MSLDLTITADPCIYCGREPESISLNYTYNVSPMWYKVFPRDDGMVQIEGMTGKEASLKLRTAIKALEQRSEEMLAIEPANGWGTFEGFLQFLKKLKLASDNLPVGTWSADR